MPFKSDQQRKFVFMKAGQGEKWAIKFLKDSDVSKETLKKVKKRAKKRKKKAKLESYNQADILANILDENLFNEVESLSKFEEYREDAERMNDIYLSTFDSYLDESRNPLQGMNKLVNHIEKVDNIYFEGATDLIRNFYSYLTDAILQNVGDVGNETDFEEIVDQFFNVNMNETRLRQDMIKTVKEKRQNLDDETVDKAVNKAIKKYESTEDTVERINLLAKHSKLIDSRDVLFIGQRIIKGEDTEDTVDKLTDVMSKSINNINKFKNENSTLILKKFNDVVSDRMIKTLGVEEAERVSIKDIYSEFAKADGEKYLFKNLSINKNFLDNLIKEAFAQKGEARVTEEERGKIINARIKAVAQITLLSFLKLLDFAAQEKVMTQRTESKGILAESLLDIYMSDVYKKNVYAEIFGIKFAKNKIKKWLNMTNFAKLTSDFKSFKKYLTSFIYNSSYGLQKLNVKTGAKLDIEDMQRVVRSGVSKESLRRASQELTTFLKSNIVKKNIEEITKDIKEDVFAKAGRALGSAMTNVGFNKKDELEQGE